jgi:hypothetical protein
MKFWQVQMSHDLSNSGSGGSSSGWTWAKFFAVSSEGGSAGWLGLVERAM